MPTKAKKKSAKSEILPQLTKPKKKKKTKSPTVEHIISDSEQPIEQGPGSEEKAVIAGTRKGFRTRKKVTFADSDATQAVAVPVPKKSVRQSKS